ncbi:hypothetical protein LL037_13115 [Clostridium estertheticum]|uniref:hypothetical protein n=1 Tax=Clostridium estertheticum TaxID=238834 RepID=UPI001C0C0A0C|nr:hypothetical protein [Clostridium estertheticum]MBU3202478.1 hypothetical protein [Clostridium estertheticum]WAG63434.1 hypothetical protein LL037_13115 [Clostridium estertheticum]
MYLQTIFIIVSVAKILEGINLISNTNGTLVKFSIKTTFHNENIREALSRNFSGTAKLLGIANTIVGIIGAIVVINANRIAKSNSTIIILLLLGLPIAMRFIVSTISKHIRE